MGQNDKTTLCRQLGNIGKITIVGKWGRMIKLIYVLK